MVYIISILLALWAAILYARHHVEQSLLLILISAFGFFELNIPPFDYLWFRLIGQNATFFSLVFILLYKLKSSGRVFKCDNTTEKFSLLIFIYSLILGFVTLFKGKESVFNVIALIKPYALFLFVFVTKDINKVVLTNLIKKLFNLAVFIGVFSLIQIALGLNILGNGGALDVAGISRYWTPYSIATFCLLYALVFNTHRKYIYIALFLLLVILPLRRGLIISTGFAIAVYYIFRIGQGKVPKGALLLALIGFFALPTLTVRFSHEGDSASDDIKSVFSGNVDYSSFSNGVTGGTFLFRMAILQERVDYLIDRPKELLTGVGLIHEDTAQKEFNFYLGSYKTVNGERYAQQIDTTDLVWPTILMRTGLLGIILHLVVFLSLVLFFIKNSKRSEWSFLGFLYLAAFLIFSFADAELTQPYAIIMYFILFTLAKVPVNSDIDYSKRISH